MNHNFVIYKFNFIFIIYKINIYILRNYFLYKKIRKVSRSSKFHLKYSINIKMKIIPR